ncbi:lamin tail domain-containing protein [bacterium]|nr:lamin tail domain-containing protein [bacterium]
MKTESTLLSIFLLAASAGLAGDIVINEIMYNSPGDDVEFVELTNNSDTAVNLQGWYLLDDNNDHDPCMLQGTLNPGAYLIIAGSRARFQAKYPGAGPVNVNEYDSGNDAWALGNGGDMVRLFDSSGHLHDIVEYADGGDWPGSPDGNGPSLELLNPGMDNALPTSWDPSKEDDGTPGERNSVYTQNASPTCKDGSRLTGLPASSDAVTVTVLAYDTEGLEKVELMVNTGTGYAPLRMNDAGSGGDAKVGDSLYTVRIPPQANGVLVKYYAVATDLIGQTDSWPNQAPDDYRAYTVGHTPPRLRITEVCAVNSSVIMDEAGEFDDWFEIHNEDQVTVDLGGMYVSSALNSSMMFELPARELAPDAYLVIWADNDAEQGLFHADFKLSSGGESVALFETNDHGNVLIHGWKFGLMSDDVSMGFRFMDDTAPEYLKNPTPGTGNDESDLFSPVCINEFQTTSDFGGPDDWVEIYNRSDEPVNLSGAFLSDQRSDPAKWQFPSGPAAVLDPGEFLVIYEDELEFGFSSEGNDVIMLTMADTATGLDFYDFGAQTADMSEGRYPDGSGFWKKFESPTRGSANMPTHVGDAASAVSPAEFRLYPNYPNPFNNETVIRFALPVCATVNVRIFNVQGKLVQSWSFRDKPAGTHQISWDGISLAGLPVPSGVYLYELQADNRELHWQETKKMLMVK